MDTQSTYNAFLRRDWIHTIHCIPSSPHQALVCWDVDGSKVIETDDWSFILNNLVKSNFYDSSVGPLKFYSYGPEESLKIVMVTKSVRKG